MDVSFNSNDSKRSKTSLKSREYYTRSSKRREGVKTRSSDKEERRGVI